VKYYLSKALLGKVIMTGRENKDSRKSEPEMLKGLPVQLFPTIEDWETWLDSNQGASAGLWVRIAKKGAPYRSATYAQLLDTALRYGWIDGQKARYDADSFLQRFTPRKGKSIWSKTNREKAVALIAEGRMEPAGLAAVEQAKGNGRWDAAYDSASSAQIPEDLAKALADNRPAGEFFETLSSTNRYAILHRLQTAVRPETRAARLEKFLAMLENRQTIHPQ
jgi:uncharacterized protein YdeI (YjbR/CyaY-like superfamily)